MVQQQNGRTVKAAHSPSRGKASSGKQTTEQGGLISRLGPVEIDWPRSLGYFGAIGLAVGIGMIDPPVGLFIAAVPLLKMLDLPRAPTPTRFIGQIIEGMAKPVGGDSQGTIRIVSQSGATDQPVDQPS